ncbi:hypothetical protein ABKN59_008095 [Abortiporus biennis]
MASRDEHDCRKSCMRNTILTKRPSVTDRPSLRHHARIEMVVMKFFSHKEQRVAIANSSMTRAASRNGVE